MTISDERQIEYFQQREAAERDMARRAPNPIVARIHRDLADSYAERARAAGAPDDLIGK